MCEISDLDLEPCERIADQERRARVPHKCSSCGAAIQPGERYRAVLYTSEDGVAFEKACPSCAAALKAFESSHAGWVAPAGLDYVLEQCIDIEPESAETFGPMLEGIRQRNRAARSRPR